MKNLVTIVALSVDTRHAVLYLANGETMTIPQGDARLPRIVEQSKFELSHGAPATVDMTPIVVQRTEFSDAEKGTKGVVKFFRVAKSFLKSLVNTESPEKVDETVAHVSPLTIGVFPGQPESKFEVVDSGMGIHHVSKEDSNQGTKEEDEAPQKPVDDPDPAALAEIATNRPQPPAQTNDQRLDAARERMQQLVGNSVGTHQPEFHTPLNEETETIVAVHEKSGTIIPDAHKLARQLRSAQKLQDYTGFEKFVERLSFIINDRTHSVEDLMKFIEKGDLPIADDGCIVIYKRLKNMGDHFVDVHSGKIRQKVGSYVFMKPGLVDPDRRQDCSNGLHVASLSYLNGFSGDVTVMAKVRPEDVFAVPAYSHNKMRVCGYHILANLPDKLRHLVNAGGSISSDLEGARLLANVLRGNHVSIIQHVEVGGHGGTNVTYTDVRASVASNEALLPVATAMTLGTASTLDMEEPLEAKLPVAPDVKAAELVAKPDENITKPVIKNLMSNSTEKKADKAESEPKPAEVTPFRSLNQKDKAARLYVAMRDAPNTVQLQEAARALREFKKQARKSWTALGLPEDAGQESGTILDKADKPAQPKAEAKAKKQVTVTQVSTKDAGKDTIVVHVTEAVTLLKDGKLSNIEIARKTGLSKDQIYRLKKKHCG